MPVDYPFFDTSYVVRLYLEDRGYEVVRKFAGAGQFVAAAWHAQAEVVTALHRAFRERKMKHRVLRAALEQFFKDRSDGIYYWLPLTDGVQQRLEAVFREAPATLFLRAADALHLACAAEHGFDKVYSNDRHLLVAATLFDLKGIDIIGLQT